MKILVAISRILVGVLFIISGLIKLNDPLGFSYKLQEYFSSDVLNIPFLEPYALGISVFVVVFEVVLGVFLLIGYKPKLRTYSLFKQDMDTERYTKIYSKSKRSILCQLRIGILPLEIELGHYVR